MYGLPYQQSWDAAKRYTWKRSSRRRLVHLFLFFVTTVVELKPVIDKLNYSLFSKDQWLYHQTGDPTFPSAQSS